MRTTATQLASAGLDGRRTAVETVLDALAAVATLNSTLHFATTSFAGTAWAAARSLDLSDRRRGALAGVPILVKAGTPPGAPVVTRLVDAGAVVVGESSRPRPGTLYQTWGWTEQGTTRNPWRTDRSPGGSSAGAASAVAAGVVPLATGGDTAGSLRIPAAFSGVVALKGTPGRIPRAGGRSRTGLSVPGVIGSCVADVALGTSIASGLHPADPTALPVWPEPDLSGDWPRPKVAFSADLGFARVDPKMAAVVYAVLADLAAADLVELVDTKVSLADPDAAWTSLYAWERGASVDPAALAAAHRLRRHNDALLAELFRQVDVLVTPTTPTTAHPHDRAGDRRHVDLCWAFNLSGHPAASVPAGLLDGLPVGLQAVAPPHRDEVALRMAALVEAAVVLPDPPVFWAAGESPAAVAAAVAGDPVVPEGAAEPEVTA